MGGNFKVNTLGDHRGEQSRDFPAKVKPDLLGKDPEKIERTEEHRGEVIEKVEWRRGTSAENPEGEWTGFRLCKSAIK